jgi:hypothetical protein
MYTIVFLSLYAVEKRKQPGPVAAAPATAAATEEETEEDRREAEQLDQLSSLIGNMKGNCSSVFDILD